MNPKTDRWEIYVDRAGRRHGRGPASSAAAERDGQVDVDSRQRTVTPAQQQQAHFGPLLQRK